MIKCKLGLDATKENMIFIFIIMYGLEIYKIYHTSHINCFCNTLMVASWSLPGWDDCIVYF